MASFQERIEDLATEGFSKSDVRRHAAEIAAEADARIAEFERVDACEWIGLDPEAPDSEWRTYLADLCLKCWKKAR